MVGNLKTKTISTLAVVSVTTGRLLTRPKEGEKGNGIEQMYELLGWMTEDSPFTHQLPRFAEECKPWLLRWFPELQEITDQIELKCDAGCVQEAQNAIISRFGPTMEIGRIPRDDHEIKDPYDELVIMRGSDEGIVIF